jgi:hypothetical protein
MESGDEFATNWQPDEIEEVADSEVSGPSSSRRSFFWLQGFAFLLGLGLLVYVINRVGVQPIFDALFGSGLVSLSSSG